MKAQTAGTGELGGGGLGPPAHAPPTVRHDARGRATGGCAETTSAGGNLLPRSPLTTDR